MKNRMKKQVKAKLLSLISVICMITCGAIVVVGLRGANRELREEQEDQLNICMYAKAYGEASAYLTDEVRAYAVTGLEKHYENYMNEINVDKNREKNLELMNEIGLSDEEMPVFDKLNSRENILLYRRDHRKFDWLSHLRIFEEAMIYGKMGDIEKATDLFNTHYSISVEEIRSQREINGETICGSRIWSTPNFNHIDYLEELADELEIRIIKPLDRNHL